MKLSSIKPNPANPRIIKDEAFHKLVNSIKEFPKMMALRPMVIDTDGTVLGGNMRLKALQHLGYKEIPDEWVRKASELTEDEKRRFIIADNVSGGQWDWDALANEWDEDELKDWGLELPTDWDTGEDPHETENPYTKKIEAPIYEPSDEKPQLTELYSNDKFNQLVSEIEGSSLDKEDKEFLKLAATRHIVFNYQNIADFYAHSDGKMQDLMEKSALVIIDFEKAIELGYVKLSEKIANQYREDYDDEE